MNIPLGKYQHFKGNFYEVIGIAKHSETLEDFVIYKALYGDGQMWARPMDNFLAQVEVNGLKVARFKKCDE